MAFFLHFPSVSISKSCLESWIFLQIALNRIGYFRFSGGHGVLGEMGS